MHRTAGGIVAGGLFVLPSLLILIALSWIYVAFGHLPLVAGILYGIKPAVTAIVVFAAYRIGSRVLKNAPLWTIAVAAFLAIFAFEIPFPWIILSAGIAGIAGGRLWPAPIRGRRTQRSTNDHARDRTHPGPPNGRRSRRRARGRQTDGRRTPWPS